MSLKYITILCYILLGFLGSSEEKTYIKTYHENGKIASEGWLRFNVPTAYWRFYHENGKISEQGSYKYGKRDRYWYFYNEYRVRTKEGHYKNGEKINWWLFYDNQGRINHKCQLSKGVKNGYCLKYMDNKLTSAEKYSNGKKIKEWTNFASFTSENSLSNLK